jgi:hypothetical protein
MPNWCDNRLRITGPAEVLDAFMAGIERTNQESMLLAYVPSPPGLNEEIILDNGETMPILGERLYQWRASNWGTKWPDSGNIYRRKGDNLLEVYFSSPWAPPEEGIASLSRIWPELDFALAFHEDGMAFAGGIFFHQGIQMEEIEDVPPSWPEDDNEDLYLEELEQMYERIFSTI